MKLRGMLTLVFLFALRAMAAQAGVVAPVHVFNFGDGENPEATMVVGADGNLYGTTYFGGTYGNGVVFMVSTNGTFTNIISFDGTNGANPLGQLARALNGNIYGTTTSGGSNNHGTVFMVMTNGTFSSLASFTNSTLNGTDPAGGLMQDIDGTFYGAAGGGGAYGYGAIFKFTGDNTNNSVLSLLVSFASTNGSSPAGTLARDTNGNFYGTTAGGGSNSYGTIFRVQPNGALTNLFSFNNTNGSAPYGTLVLGWDTNFYGTTANGGSNGYGTVFQVSTNGAVSNLVMFNNTNGAHPYTGLCAGPDGNLYGVTHDGGANTYGTLFQITSNHTFNSLISFKSSTARSPYGGLTLGDDGNLYGTSAIGGGNTDGTVFCFVINPAATVFQSVTQTNGVAALAWNTLNGFTYQLQYRTNLNQTNWLNLGSSSVSSNATLSLPATNGPDAQRFYRAVLLQ